MWAGNFVLEPAAPRFQLYTEIIVDYIALDGKNVSHETSRRRAEETAL
jgi:hypothetical protein